jgi:hypothetical protein
MKPSEVDAVARAILEEVGKRLSAYSMRLDALEVRLAAIETKAEGRERQLDRHAEHLRRIETRTAALERGK